MEQRALLRKWPRRILFFGWPVFNVVQWILLLGYASGLGLFFELPDRISADREVAFVRDFFFILWNLLPFLAVFSLLRAEREIVETWRIVPCPRQGERKARKRQVLLVLFVVAGVCVAYLGVREQFTKVENFDSK